VLRQPAPDQRRIQVGVAAPIGSYFLPKSRFFRVKGICFVVRICDNEDGADKLSSASPFSKFLDPPLHPIPADRAPAFTMIGWHLAPAPAAKSGKWQLKMASTFERLVIWGPIFEKSS